MNNTNNKTKRHFNVIDILILLALLAIAAFAANYIVNDMFSKELAEVEYILRLDGVSENDIMRLSDGDPVFANASGTTLGTIREITQTEYKKAIYNAQTGRFVYTAIPEKYTVYLRVNAVCTRKDHQYLIGDYRISAGTSPDILLPFLLDRAEIISVKPILQNSLSDTGAPENLSAPKEVTE